MEKVTAKKIAELAGVSKMTVSNVVLNNDSKVSPQTKQRVQKLIEKYDFVPNQNASNLRSRSSKLLGVLLYYNTKTYDVDFSDPFVSSVLTGIEKAATQAGYFTMIKRFSSAKEIQELQKNWIFAGFIIISVPASVFPSVDKTVERPVSYIDNSFAEHVSGRKNRNFIETDESQVSEHVAKHLKSKGHEKILFFSFNFDPAIPGVMQKRYQAFLKYYPDVILKTVTTSNYSKILSEVSDFLTEQPFSAIYATADILAAKLNLIFKDISIIGVDDADFDSFISPKLTTVKIDQTEKGRLAVEYLIESIQTGSSKDFYSDSELIERDSVRKIK